MSLYQLNVIFNGVGVMSGYEPQCVFNYRSATVDPTPAASAQDLVAAFVDNITTNIQGVMSVFGKVVGYDCVNLYDVTDFWEAVTDVTGVQTGDSMPRFVSWTYKSPRLAVGKNKRARKAIPFVPELQTAQGSPVAGFVAALGNLGDAMSDVISSIANPNANYTPIMVEKELYTAPSGKPAYRYYATESEQLSHLYVIPSYNPAVVSTQNSRKG